MKKNRMFGRKQGDWKRMKILVSWEHTGSYWVILGDRETVPFIRYFRNPFLKPSDSSWNHISIRRTKQKRDRNPKR